MMSDKQVGEVPELELPPRIFVSRVDKDGVSLAAALDESFDVVKERLSGCNFMVATTTVVEPSVAQPMVVYRLMMCDATDAAHEVAQLVTKAHSRFAKEFPATRQSPTEWLLLGLCVHGLSTATLQVLFQKAAESINVRHKLLSSSAYIDEYPCVPHPQAFCAARPYDPDELCGLFRDIITELTTRRSFGSLMSFQAIDRPVTAPQQPIHYCLFLWYPRYDSRILTFSRRQTAAPRPAKWQIMLEAQEGKWILSTADASTIMEVEGGSELEIAVALAGTPTHHNLSMYCPFAGEKRTIAATTAEQLRSIGTTALVRPTKEEPPKSVVTDEAIPKTSQRAPHSVVNLKGVDVVGSDDIQTVAELKSMVAVAGKLGNTTGNAKSFLLRTLAQSGGTVELTGPLRLVTCTAKLITSKRPGSNIDDFDVIFSAK